jgi:hypothetical protein
LLIALMVLLVGRDFIRKAKTVKRDAAEQRQQTQQEQK